MKEEKIFIFDTTLRDGEQSPGAVLKPQEKLQIAMVLEELGVDVIEAGFPISSPGDFQAVQTIAKKIRRPTICALARTLEKDIKIAWEAVKTARKPRLHTFIGISDIHLRHQLRKEREEILKIVNNAVKQAKTFTKEVEFSPMDATRANKEFLFKVLKTAIKSGATILNIPDTVGYALPWEMEDLVKKIKRNIKLNKNILLSVHCHNDLGLATANSLAAIKAGARQVEATINGIGERAGNTSLEETVMILKVRRNQLKAFTNIQTEKIYKISRLVSKLTRMPVQPNKAITGRNAFAHASGVHQDGYLKKREAFEIIEPSSIGLKSARIILGARSGKHALKYRLSLLNIFPSDEELLKIYERFLKIADKKRVVTNKDLISIMKS